MGIQISLKPYHSRVGVMNGPFGYWIYDVFIMFLFNIVKRLHRMKGNVMVLAFLIHYPNITPYIYINSMPTQNTDIIVSTIAHEEVHRVLRREAGNDASRAFDLINRRIDRHLYEYPWVVGKSQGGEAWVIS